MHNYYVATGADPELNFAWKVADGVAIHSKIYWYNCLAG